MLASGVLFLALVQPVMVHIYGFTQMVDVACEGLIACHTVHCAPAHLPVHATVDCLVAIAERAVELLLKLWGCLQSTKDGALQGSALCMVQTMVPLGQNEVSIQVQSPYAAGRRQLRNMQARNTPMKMCALQTHTPNSSTMLTFLGGGFALLLRFPMLAYMLS